MKHIITIFSFAILAMPGFAFAQTYIYETQDKTLRLPYDTIQSITPIDLGNDGTSELLVGSPPGFVGKVYLVRLDGSIINSWLAYNESFRGGVNVAAGDLDGDAIPEIVTAPAGGGGPHVRIFDGYGNPKLSLGFFASDANNTNGVSISIKKFEENKPSIAATTYSESGSKLSIFSAQGKLTKSYPLPQKENPESHGPIAITITENHESKTEYLPPITKSIEQNGKVIIIDLSEQTLSYFEDGYRIATRTTSTGKPGYKTPIGEYSINNKSKLAFSKRYGLYMPYWMSFIGGLYGIHELPYWPSGYREGEDHLGTPVSHGCVRLGMDTAQALFEWAEVGTLVVVQE
jgi:lipoprotein-anchoring transpeptidase ErfK/SrfK